MLLLSLPAAITRPLARGADVTRGVLGGLTWGPALAVAKPAILSVLSQIEIGTLLLVDEPAGTRLVYGQKLGGNLKDGELPNGIDGVRRATTVPRVELVVKKETFWMRLFLFADMGFSESYMLGEIECADLTAFFQVSERRRPPPSAAGYHTAPHRAAPRRVLRLSISGCASPTPALPPPGRARLTVLRQLFILNRDRMGNGTTWFSSISHAISSIARTTNTLSNSLLNISAHYDISNDMFAAFLSPDMTYSCPIWRPFSPSDSREETLEEAQMTKLQRFIDGAHIKSTDHVLEIGTGWGSFAIAAARQTGCHITSLTLSKEQKTLAEARIAEAGLSDRIQVLLMDYRKLPVPDRPYDKIVSIEMLEAVGQEFLATYFGCINRLLKKDGGIAVFQCITMPEGRHDAYSRGEE